MAFDSPEARQPSPPISLHPAFPMIVALWFAVLLGLGSLVLPGALLDRLVVATGLAAAVPAAGPPLGLTARAAIALVATLGGAALGVVIARRVAAAQGAAPKAPRTKDPLGTRRPINVHEELGGDGLTNGHALPLSRRRALLLADDDQPGPMPHVVPLPGEDVHAPEAAFAAAPAPFADDEPLELSEVAEDEPSSPLADPVGLPDDAFEEAFEQDPAMTDEDDFLSDPPFEHFAEPTAPIDDLEARNSAAGVRGAEPPPFAAPPLSRDEPRPGDEAPAEPNWGSESEPVLQQVAGEPAPACDAEWEKAAPEDLGLVQLVQRLGSAIEKRRELIAQRHGAPAPAPLPLRGLEAAHAEEAARAKAAYFGAVPSEGESDEALADTAPQEFIPAGHAQEATAPADEPPVPALRPAFLRGLTAAPEDDEDDDHAFPDFSLPGRQPVASAPVPETQAELGEEDADEDSPSDESFPSLLAMRSAGAGEKKAVTIGHDEPTNRAPPNGFETDAQRLFDPPAEETAADPFVPPPPAADTDIALRTALATLQRITGAG